MTAIKRRLRMALPSGQSAFLWGARKTGKSTLLREAFPESIVYDFLKSDLVIALLKRPSLLREQLEARPRHPTCGRRASSPCCRYCLAQ
jgi:predicted AAA+ superfamily ATPase